MPEFTEIDAIKAIDEALSKISDEITRKRIIGWTLEKYSTGSSHDMRSQDQGIRNLEAPTSKVKKHAKKRTRKSGKQKTSIPIDKNLNLKPANKQGFKDFATAKNPADNQQKATVAVYYLSKVIELEKISHSQILTCYKHVGWRVPDDLRNVISLTSSRKGWLNTSDSTDIKVTTLGENLVEHDLPAKEKTSGR